MTALIGDHMTLLPLQTPQTVPPGTALAVAQALGYLLVVVAGVGLLWYLREFATRLLAEPFRTRWRYLAVGVGAAVVYGAAGLAELLATPAAEPFRRGATLFVFLFCAVGLRGVHRSVGGAPLVGDTTFRRVAPGVVLSFVAAWWASYLLASSTVVAVVELGGLVVAVAYALYHAVAIVRVEEGTSVAAVTRQFVPALLALAVVAAAEHVAAFAPDLVAVGDGVALVGVVLAGAFLFTTAVAIRQQGGELERIYDPTTWRGEEADLSEPK
jgi:hypothetical protein